MKLRLSTAVAIGAAIVMALFLARGAPAVTGVPCAPTGLEQIATGFPDYMPEETVRVDGSGFQAGCDVTMQVTRPDGSIVVGDGSFTPGSDVVETDFAGNLAYDYTLDGIQGDYQVQALGEGGVVLASTTFSDSINNPPWVYADTNYTAEAFLFERGSTVYFRVPVSGAGNYYKLIVPSPSTFTSGCLAPSGGYITTSWATQSTDQLYQPGYSITINQYSGSG